MNSSNIENNLSEPLINKQKQSKQNEETSNINSNLKIQKWNNEIENLLKSWGEKSGVSQFYIQKTENINIKVICYLLQV